MASRNSLDHAGFMERRGPAGAGAENVAMGCETEACAKRMWMQSPRHNANMVRGGCQAVGNLRLVLRIDRPLARSMLHGYRSKLLANLLSYWPN
jgi:hypothetical protein